MAISSERIAEASKGLAPFERRIARSATSSRSQDQPIQFPAEIAVREYAVAIMKRWLFLALWVLPLLAQSNTGELRLKVTDPAGLGAKSSVEIVSGANHYRQSLLTDDAGNLAMKRLPFGVYLLEVRHAGFATFSASVEIRSAAPTSQVVQLSVAPVKTSIEVKASDTLIDPERAGCVNQIGSETLSDRVTSLPGRSVQDLVDSQPGWLFEGNAVLHPRGSEYQTQFVVDGIPLTDNRSPGYGPEIEADNVESMSVYTAGIPAEYGRKMGGVVEVNTARDTQQGFHGEVVLSGGSFDTAGGYSMLQYLDGKNTFGVTAAGAMTGRYLSPPVPENYTNNGTTGDFSGFYERDFTPSDRLSLMFRHELARFDIPNEYVQQAAGQRQDGDIFENLGMFSYQHLFSANTVGTLEEWCATTRTACRRTCCPLPSSPSRATTLPKPISRVRSRFIAANRSGSLAPNRTTFFCTNASLT